MDKQKQDDQLEPCCIVVRKRYTVKERVNYLLTEVVKSYKYHKSCAVGITSEDGLTTDRDLAELRVLKKHDVFYTSAIPEVTWYEPLYNKPTYNSSVPIQDVALKTYRMR